MHHIGLFIAKGRGAKVVSEVSFGALKVPWFSPSMTALCVCVFFFFFQFSSMRFYGEDAGSSGWTAMAKYGYYGKKFINFDNDFMEMVR